MTDYIKLFIIMGILYLLLFFVLIYLMSFSQEAGISSSSITLDASSILKLQFSTQELIASATIRCIDFNFSWYLKFKK